MPLLWLLLAAAAARAEVQFKRTFQGYCQGPEHRLAVRGLALSECRAACWARADCVRFGFTSPAFNRQARSFCCLYSSCEAPVMDARFILFQRIDVARPVAPQILAACAHAQKGELFLSLSLFLLSP
eukprot:TRINITY_DN15114_c0_g1_i1.p2 TRINITY_DN15114_c0_g1~~TRINITY_DN15114_c0_g1_i1.p2  ORF type:complete len:145 (+),score=60.80 TRINITY_DN15114_c0_g1_i1:56-436(+)